MDGAIPREQAVKLCQCLTHFDGPEARKRKIEQEILIITEFFPAVLNLLYSLLGLTRTMTAIAIFSEAGFLEHRPVIEYKVPAKTQALPELFRKGAVPL